MRANLVRLLWLVVLGGLVGCARVDIRKVPARSDYKDWDDAEQRAADNICGARYYLPRPYVSVDRPFTVGGGDVMVPATVDEQGRVLTISLKGLPRDLQRQLPAAEGVSEASLDVTTVHVANANGRGFARPPGDSQGVRQQAGDAPKPTVKTFPDLLKGSSLSITFLTASDTATKLTVKLDKSHPFANGTEPRPCLVPMSEDASKPLTDDLVAFTPDPPAGAFEAGKDGTWTATVPRSQVETHGAWTVAVLVNTKEAALPAATPNSLHLITSDKPFLSVLAPKPAGTKPEGKKTEEKRTEEEQQPPVPSSVLASSGDPNTSPLLEVNDYVSVVLLPDFEEQYAMSSNAGLGLASASLGLENGWMVEKMGWQVDNREVGRFVFKQIEKFADILADVARTELLPTVGDPGTEEAQAAVEDAASVSQQAGGDRRALGRVLLRLRWIVEAEPGLYPILKPWEIENWRRNRNRFAPRNADGSCLAECTDPPCEEDDGVLIPFRPYTVAAYNVRRKLAVEILSTRKAASGPPPPPSVLAATPATDDEVKALKKYLTDELKDLPITMASKVVKRSGLAWLGGEGNVAKVEWTAEKQWRISVKDPKALGSDGAKPPKVPLLKVVREALQAGVGTATSKPPARTSGPNAGECEGIDVVRFVAQN